MNNLVKSRIKEITDLHNEIGGYIKVTLDKAIRIGELLSQQKEELKHGEFTSWIEDNLPFTDRTARNYMNIFRNRERLKTETVSDLTTAYKLLEEPKPKKEKQTFENVTESYKDQIIDMNKNIKEMVCKMPISKAFAGDYFPCGIPMNRDIAIWKLDCVRKFGKILNELIDKWNLEEKDSRLFLSHLDYLRLTYSELFCYNDVDKIDFGSMKKYFPNITNEEIIKIKNVYYEKLKKQDIGDYLIFIFNCLKLTVFTANEIDDHVKQKTDKNEIVTDNSLIGTIEKIRMKNHLLSFLNHKL